MSSWTNFLNSDFGYYFRNLMDFAILYALVYSILYFLRGSKTLNLLWGIFVSFVVLVLLAGAFKLPTMGQLLLQIWTFLGLAIVIIFHPELRRAMAQAGTVFFKYTRPTQDVVDEVALAAIQMAETKTGALIVFEQNMGLASIINTSVRLDAGVKALLLESIFFKNSPLHDCAVIIKENRIVAARAVLPLMQEDPANPVKNRLGTRHRAAIGITEETDAIALVVSEERGLISLAHKGRLIQGIPPKELVNRLNKLLQPTEKEQLKLSWFRDLWKHPDEADAMEDQEDLLNLNMRGKDSK